MNMSNDDLSDRRPSDQIAASGGNGISPSLIGFVIVAVLAIVFFFQNGDMTNIDLWLIDWDTTVRWSIMVSIGLGIALDRLFGMWWRRRGKRKADTKRSARA